MYLIIIYLMQLYWIHYLEEPRLLIKTYPRDVMMLCLNDFKDVMPPGDGVNRICAVLRTSATHDVFRVQAHFLLDNVVKARVTTSCYAVSSLPENTTNHFAATVALKKYLSENLGVHHEA